MKAWIAEGNGRPEDVLRIADRIEPKPIPGELGVVVQAAGIGLPDLLLCLGRYEFRPEPPFTPGQEVSGIVTEPLGSSLRTGQRAMGVTAFYRGHGGFAERSVLVADATWPIPDTMSDAEAAGFGIPFRTAYLGLVARGQLRAGETLLVHGAAGGTGFAAVQLGAALGARVLAVASGPEKCAMCRALGADVAIDRDDEEFVAAVKEQTGGRGADLVFDPVGGDTFVRSLDCMATGGRLLAVGFASGAWADAPTSKLVARNLTVVGVIAVAPDPAVAEEMRSTLFALHREGRIGGPPVASFDFDDLPRALAALDQGTARGKQVLHVG